MKPDTNLREKPVSSQTLSEADFGIGDPQMISQILRQQLYSDPIRVVCQEYSCNARDAHREVGKENVPIQVTLPTSLNPVFTVQDFGPGIDPDRMVNVFIKYGNSTKRADNVQTGGFGIGAKSGWAYSDQFNIRTVVDGKEYYYSAILDEDNNGKLHLLSENQTDAPNGTTIIIPVKSRDIRYFTDAVLNFVKYWSVKPIVENLGYNIPDELQDFLLKGENWLVKKGGGFHRNSFAIVDGIPYTINTQTFYDDDKVDSDLVKIFTFNQILLFFNTGEVTLAANRENLFYDNKTKTAILDKLHHISKTAKKEIKKEIDKLDNLRDVRKYLINLSRSDFYERIKKSQEKITWRGKEIQLDEYFSLLPHTAKSNIKVMSYTVGGGSTKRLNRTDTFFLKENPPLSSTLKTHSVAPNRLFTPYLEQNKHRGETDILVDDLENKSSKSRVKYYLQQKGQYSSALVFSFEVENKKEIADWKKKNHWDDYQFTLISSLPEPPKSSSTNNNNTNNSSTKPRSKTDLTEFSASVLCPIKGYKGKISCYHMGVLNTKGCKVNLESGEGYYLEFSSGLPIDKLGKTMENSKLDKIVELLSLEKDKPIFCFTKATLPRAKASKLVHIEDAYKDFLSNLKKKSSKNKKVVRAHLKLKQYRDFGFGDNLNKWGDRHRLGDFFQYLIQNPTALELDKLPKIKEVFEIYQEIESLKNLLDKEDSKKIISLFENGTLVVKETKVTGSMKSKNTLTDELINAYPVLTLLDSYTFSEIPKKGIVDLVDLLNCRAKAKNNN